MIFKSVRRKLAQFIYPIPDDIAPGKRAPIAISKPGPKDQLLILSEILAAHDGVTHWAISMRLPGRGDFFKQLRKPGRDIRFGTYDRLLRKFSEVWPSDLEWPANIPRPEAPTRNVRTAP